MPRLVMMVMMIMVTRLASWLQIQSWSTWKQEQSCRSSLWPSLHYKPHIVTFVKFIPFIMTMITNQLILTILIIMIIMLWIILMTMLQGWAASCAELWFVHMTTVHGQPRSGGSSNHHHDYHQHDIIMTTVHGQPWSSDVDEIMESISPVRQIAPELFRGGRLCHRLYCRGESFK